jgi:hypothetical protein
VADVEESDCEATRLSFTTIAICTSCGRVGFAGCWQDLGDGLQGYLAELADSRSICPRCAARPIPLVPTLEQGPEPRHTHLASIPSNRMRPESRRSVQEEGAS